MPVWTEQTELPLLVSPAAAGSSPVPAARGDERPGTAVRCGDGASAGRTVQLALPGHSVVPLPGPGFVPQTMSTAGDSSDEGGEFLQ